MSCHNNLHNTYSTLIPLLLVFTCTALCSPIWISDPGFRGALGYLDSTAADDLAGNQYASLDDVDDYPRSGVNHPGSGSVTDGPEQNSTLYNARARVNHPNTTSSGKEKWRQVANGVEVS